MSHAPATPATPAPARPRGRHRWPLILAGMLAVHATLIIYAATLAVSDKSFAVVPGYYDKALSWDADRADRRAADDRGWSFELRPGAFADAGGQRLIVAELRDAAGAPLPGAAVTLEFFRHARASQAARVAMRETTPGRHEAVAAVAAAGAWRFNARVSLGDQQAAFDQDLTVGAAPPAPAETAP